MPAPYPHEWRDDVVRVEELGAAGRTSDAHRCRRMLIETKGVIRCGRSIN